MNKSINEFRRKYRDLLSINRSIIISGIVSFMIGTIFTELYAEYAYHGKSIDNSVYTLIIGYATYLPLFGYLYLRDNKVRYVDPADGRISLHKLVLDIRKLIAAFSISEVIFIVTKTYVHFHQLELGYLEAYQAYFVAELAAWGVYFLSVNTILSAIKKCNKLANS